MYDSSKNRARQVHHHPFMSDKQVEEILKLTSFHKSARITFKVEPEVKNSTSGPVIVKMINSGRYGHTVQFRVGRNGSCRAC